MRAARRGSLRALPVWSGAAAYLAYNDAIFSFALPFNSLFLGGVTTLSLSVWTIVALAGRMDRLGVARAVERDRWIGAAAIYLGGTAVLFAGLWLAEILPATVANARPRTLREAGLLTNPVYVLDLAFALPASAAAAVRLWQRRRWGVALAATMLSMLTIESLSIASDQFFGGRADPGSVVAAVRLAPVFLVLAAVNVAAAVPVARKVGH